MYQHSSDTLPHSNSTAGKKNNIRTPDRSEHRDHLQTPGIIKLLNAIAQSRPDRPSSAPSPLARLEVSNSRRPQADTMTTGQDRTGKEKTRQDKENMDTHQGTDAARSSSRCARPLSTNCGGALVPRQDAPDQVRLEEKGQGTGSTPSPPANPTASGNRISTAALLRTKKYGIKR